MLFIDFHAKIQQLNEQLYVRTSERNRVTDEIGSFGLYHKGQRQKIDIAKNRRNAVDHHHEVYLNALESGELDKFICGVPADYVPEYDVFDFVHTRILMPGWRTIVMSLVKKKLVTLDKARKVFQCSGLGESTYDKMEFFDKFAYAKALAKAE